jgi:hypothetical protein
MSKKLDPEKTCSCCDEKEAFFQISLSGPDGTVYDSVLLCAECAGVTPGEQAGGIVIDRQRMRRDGIYDFQLNYDKLSNGDWFNA